MFTTTNAETGSSTGTQTVKIDLTNYAMKKDTATKEEFENLVEVVANKLDKNPQHHHKISEIDELQAELNGKYDKNSKYSYNVILSDSEKIPFLENTKIISLEISSDKNSSGYVFKIDSSSGDLQILKNNIVIMNYNSGDNQWLLNGVAIYEILLNHSDGLSGLQQRIREIENAINELATQIQNKL